MTDKCVVAVPSMAPGGLDAVASGHFGHCDVFTIVTIENGKIGEVSLKQNVPHEQGGCLAPVNMLAEKSVNALVAGGMGARPLMGFNSAGIGVFYNNGIVRVDRIIEAFAKGQLPEFPTITYAVEAAEKAVAEDISRIADKYIHGLQSLI